MEKLSDLIPVEAARAATKKGRKLELLYNVMVLGGAESGEKARVSSIRKRYIYAITDENGMITNGHGVEKDDIEFMNEMWQKYKGAKRYL